MPPNHCSIWTASELHARPCPHQSGHRCVLSAPRLISCAKALNGETHHERYDNNHKYSDSHFYTSCKVKIRIKGPTGHLLSHHPMTSHPPLSLTRARVRDSCPQTIVNDLNEFTSFTLPCIPSPQGRNEKSPLSPCYNLTHGHGSRTPDTFNTKTAID